VPPVTVRSSAKSNWVSEPIPAKVLPGPIALSIVIPSAMTKTFPAFPVPDAIVTSAAAPLVRVSWPVVTESSPPLPEAVLPPVTTLLSIEMAPRRGQSAEGCRRHYRCSGQRLALRHYWSV
jgi:hypothetical protein